MEHSLRADLGAVIPAGRAPTIRIAVNADSLSTWFIPALAGIEARLFDLVIDDESNTAGWLRRGEVSQYTQLLEDSRRHAIDRLVDNARLVGADGVLAVRFDSSEIGQQLTEIVANLMLTPVALTEKAEAMTQH